MLIMVAAEGGHCILILTLGNQRYFGDWVSYCGHGDVGYYLGARFLQFICRSRAFDDVLALTHGEVEGLFLAFADQALRTVPSS